MQRAGAAEGDERELARVVAALDRDEPQRAQHLRVDDLDRLGRVDPVERALGRLAVELEPAGQARGKPAEQEVRVGHRRPRPAPPVAGGPGIGAGALGADAQRAARVAPDDRAAARADGLQVDHRQPQRQPADLALRAARRPRRPGSGRRPSRSRPCRA